MAKKLGIMPVVLRRQEIRKAILVRGIPKTLAAQFKQVCRARGAYMSSVIEQFMQDTCQTRKKPFVGLQEYLTLRHKETSYNLFVNNIPAATLDSFKEICVAEKVKRNKAIVAFVRKTVDTEGEDIGPLERRVLRPIQKSRVLPPCNLGARSSKPR